MAWSDREKTVYESQPWAQSSHIQQEYPVILADPPWKYQNWTDKSSGAASSCYGCLSVDDICEIPVADMSAKDALLFLWATGPKLPEALRVMLSWGFQYVGIAFDWIKTYRDPIEVDSNGVRGLFLPLGVYCGLGFRTRQGTELCLLGKRGKGVPKKSSSVLATIVSRRREHSRKPDETYDRIEELVDGPYLELFARTTRAGWDCWGNEVGKFDE